MDSLFLFPTFSNKKFLPDDSLFSFYEVQNSTEGFVNDAQECNGNFKICQWKTRFSPEHQENIIIRDKIGSSNLECHLDSVGIQAIVMIHISLI
jgi:hypothetical protein